MRSRSATKVTARPALTTALSQKNVDAALKEIEVLGSCLATNGGAFVSIAMAALDNEGLRRVLPPLLSFGASVEGNWHDRKTPLHQAVLSYRPTDILDLLHVHGPDLDVGFSKAGDPALILAAREHNAPALRWLLDHGADPNVRDAEGKTALGLLGENVWLFKVDALDAECGSPKRSTVRQMLEVFLDHGTTLGFFRDMLRAQRPGTPLPIDRELAAWEAERASAALDTVLPGGTGASLRPRL